jgi:SP family general alpha glucoside:H+ symporter-like MFS transporter
MAQWFLMPYIGRRTLFLWGLVADCVMYFVLGGLGVPKNEPSLSWGIASLLVINGFIGYLCIEPIVFSLAAEVPSSVLRSKSVALGRIIYQFCNIAASVIAPYQISSSAWNWGAKSGFFWGGFCVIALVYSYFCLPETKDRTGMEIDLLFEKRVPARKFAKTNVYASEAAIHVQ